jgi:hypothetical protein
VEQERVPGLVERNTQSQVVSQQRTHLRRCGGREKVRADVFRADRVGFPFLVIFALIVTVDGHGEAESYNEREQRERGGMDHAEIFTLVTFKGSPLPEKKGS